MKRILVCLFTCISITAFANNHGKPATPVYRDTTVLSLILSLPLQNYIGKPVDSLLNVLPGGYTTRTFMPLRIGYCRGVSQMYFSGTDNNCFVEIYIDNFQFLPIPNRSSTATWNMALAQQETIAYIKVVKNNFTCVYGCSNPNYYYP